MALHFRTAARFLATSPQAGRPHPDSPAGEFRLWRVPRWLLAYRADERPIAIVRMVHAARDPDEIAGDL